MKLTPIMLDEAYRVALNMREADAREIYATRWTPDPWDLAIDCTLVGRFGWIASLDEPIAVIGAAPQHPGVWNVFCFATDRFRQISTSLTKHVINIMIPSLIAAGAHRAECYSIEGHDEAHRWLEYMGARRESVRPHFGRNKENFFLYSWTEESFDELRLRTSQRVLQVARDGLRRSRDEAGR